MGFFGKKTSTKEAVGSMEEVESAPDIVVPDSRDEVDDGIPINLGTEDSNAEQKPRLRHAVRKSAGGARLPPRQPEQFVVARDGTLQRTHARHSRILCAGVVLRLFVEAPRHGGRHLDARLGPQQQPSPPFYFAFLVRRQQYYTSSRLLLEGTLLLLLLAVLFLLVSLIY